MVSFDDENVSPHLKKRVNEVNFRFFKPNPILRHNIKKEYLPKRR